MPSADEPAPARIHVLVVDDDPEFRRFTAVALEEAGMATVEADGVPAALAAIEGGTPLDLVLLDVQMPETPGWELVERLRVTGRFLPVIFLTSVGAPESRVRGLELGADDYLVKPVDYGELVARIHAVLRRHRAGFVLEAGELELDLLHRAARLAGKALHLSPKEFELLAALTRGAGTTLSREELLGGIWGMAPGSETNVLEVHVGRLRRKLGSRRPRIETIRGEGYRLIG